VVIVLRVNIMNAAAMIVHVQRLVIHNVTSQMPLKELELKMLIF
jgi:hypothetical protein